MIFIQTLITAVSIFVAVWLLAMVLLLALWIFEKIQRFINDGR
jgi:type II secretory pathway component PulJ